MMQNLLRDCYIQLHHGFQTTELFRIKTTKYKMMQQSIFCVWSSWDYHPFICLLKMYAYCKIDARFLWKLFIVLQYRMYPLAWKIHNTNQRKIYDLKKVLQSCISMTKPQKACRVLMPNKLRYTFKLLFRTLVFFSYIELTMATYGYFPRISRIFANSSSML